MNTYLTVALLALAAPMVLSTPSGLLTIGGPIIGAPGLLGAGYGYGLGAGYGGYGYGLGAGYGYGGAVIAAPSSISVQKTIIAHPSPAIAVAAPAVVAAPAALAVPSPVAKTLVAGPSGVITAKQSLAGTFATVTGPAELGLGHGHGDY